MTIGIGSGQSSAPTDRTATFGSSGSRVTSVFVARLRGEGGGNVAVAHRVLADHQVDAVRPEDLGQRWDVEGLGGGDEGFGRRLGRRERLLLDGRGRRVGGESDPSHRKRNHETQGEPKACTASHEPEIR